MASGNGLNKGEDVVSIEQPKTAQRPMHLNTLVHLQAIIERARISAGNQVLHIEDEAARDLTATIKATLADLEAKIEAHMARTVQEHPAWPWLKKVKGVGPQTASLMLAYLLPPREDKGPSSWYKAAGLYAITLPSANGEEQQSRMPRYQHFAAMG